MGFGLFWDMQFHQSWVLLPPFVLLALVLRLRDKRFHFVHDFISFLVGSAPLAALLIPTYLKYGFAQGSQGFQLFQLFNTENFRAFFTILGRFLSLPSFETLRFMGMHTNERKDFLLHLPWILLPGIFMVLMGWLQPLSLFVLGFFKNPHRREDGTVTKVALFAFLMVWMSFWFTSKEPLAHIYYILMPILTVYSIYMWSRWAPKRGWRLFAVVCIMANLWFEAGYLIHMMGAQSLYTNRAQIMKAFQQKDDRILGERRPGSIN
jgi:hypothetical protein